MKQYQKIKKRNVVPLTNINMKSISALKISRKYFIRGRSSENRIIKLIAKYIHAVKCKFRQFSRPLRGIGAIHFGYRQFLLIKYYFFDRFLICLFGIPFFTDFLLIFYTHFQILTFIIYQTLYRTISLMALLTPSALKFIGSSHLLLWFFMLL